MDRRKREKKNDHVTRVRWKLAGNKTPPRRAPPASSSAGGARTTASSRRISRRRSPTSSPACTRCLELATLARCCRLVINSCVSSSILVFVLTLYSSDLAPQELPEEHRGDAVSSMVYEANARMRDPVYGCVGAISYLQQQIDGLRQQLALTQAEMLQLRVRQAVTSSHATSPSSSLSQLSSYTLLSHSKASNFDMDMVVEQAMFSST